MNLQDITAVIDIILSEILCGVRAERIVKRCAENNISCNFWKKASLIDIPKLECMCSIYNINIACCILG
jgi:hypothetical protein